MAYQNEKETTASEKDGNLLPEEQTVREQQSFALPNSLMMAMPMTPPPGAPNSVMRELLDEQDRDQEENKFSSGSTFGFPNLIHRNMLTNYGGSGYDSLSMGHELSHTIRRESVFAPVSLTAPFNTIQRAGEGEEEEVEEEEEEKKEEKKKESPPPDEPPPPPPENPSEGLESKSTFEDHTSEEDTSEEDVSEEDISEDISEEDIADDHDDGGAPPAVDLQQVQTDITQLEGILQNISQLSANQIEECNDQISQMNEDLQAQGEAKEQERQELQALQMRLAEIPQNIIRIQENIAQLRAQIQQGNPDQRQIARLRLDLRDANRMQAAVQQAQNLPNIRTKQAVKGKIEHVLQAVSLEFFNIFGEKTRRKPDLQAILARQDDKLKDLALTEHKTFEKRQRDPDKLERMVWGQVEDGLRRLQSDLEKMRQNLEKSKKKKPDEVKEELRQFMYEAERKENEFRGLQNLRADKEGLLNQDANNPNTTGLEIELQAIVNGIDAQGNPNPGEGLPPVNQVFKPRKITSFEAPDIPGLVKYYRAWCKLNGRDLGEKGNDNDPIRNALDAVRAHMAPPPAPPSAPPPAPPPVPLPRDGHDGDGDDHEEVLAPPPIPVERPRELEPNPEPPEEDDRIIHPERDPSAIQRREEEIHRVRANVIQRAGLIDSIRAAYRRRHPLPADPWAAGVYHGGATSPNRIWHTQNAAFARNIGSIVNFGSRFGVLIDSTHYGQKTGSTGPWDLEHSKHDYGKWLNIGFPFMDTALSGYGLGMNIVNFKRGWQNTSRARENQAAGASSADAWQSGIDTASQAVSGLGNAWKTLAGFNKLHSLSSSYAGTGWAKGIAGVHKFVSAGEPASILPWVGIFTGAASATTGTMQAIRGRMTRSELHDAERKMKNVAPDPNAAAPVPGRKTDQQKLQDIMEQGHHIAKLNMWSGGLKAAAGGLSAAGSISTLCGAAPVAAGFQGAAAAVNMAKFIFERSYKYFARRKAVARELNIDWSEEKKDVNDMIHHFCPEMHVRDHWLREVILKAHGMNAVDQKDAYNQIKQQRAHYLMGLATGNPPSPYKEVAETVIEAMGVHKIENKQTGEKRFAAGAEQLLAEKLSL